MAVRNGSTTDAVRNCKDKLNEIAKHDHLVIATAKRCLCGNGRDCQYAILATARTWARRKNERLIIDEIKRVFDAKISGR